MKKRYLLFALILFIIEVIIALYVRDSIIRPYGGDFLVVIFLYCLLRGIWNQDVVVSLVCLVLFAYLVELLQYLNIVDLLGLSSNRFAVIVIGTGFSWLDILAYTLGGVFIYVVEKGRTLRS